MSFDYMPSETFQRADLDLLLSVRVDVAQVPGGASQRQILDAVRVFLGSLKRDDSTDGRALDPVLGFARPYYAGGFTVGVVPASGRGKVALAGSHEGAQTIGSGRFSEPLKGKAGWRIVTSVVVSSAGEDVLDSIEAGIEYLTDALDNLRIGLSLTELPVA
ncbi:hypothetical protein [Rothia dentocariosa]|uniref:hypothetical protein n=1 Tax=Rothia dentocariosa TaxID=2047 RepID=UPI0028E23EC5|nr:hypothetical protein [Rothia dentocariosa]